jgi:hypothetical protein
MSSRLFCSLGAALLLCGSTAFAFNGHRVTEGPLTLTIGDIPTVTAIDTPQDVSVELKNTGAEPLPLTIELKGLVDSWKAVGPTRQQATLAPQGQAVLKFQITAGVGAYSALYPVHVYATFQQGAQPTVAHAVAIFETNLPLPTAVAPAEPPVNVLPVRGSLALASLKTQRVAWANLGGPLVYMPVGWKGSDPRSSASFSTASVNRGDTRLALQMHPAYRPKAGTVFAEYRVKLPAGQPIRMTFYHAMRDTAPKEPPSDGVTFRVWVGDEQVYQQHTNSHQWVPGEVDLTRFAGRDILLRLESHPGPKNSTTCDSSYWGDPTITTGAAPAILSPDQKRSLADQACAALTTAKDQGKSVFAFDLGGTNRAALALGPNGLADGVLAFAAARRTLWFDGLQISVFDQRLGTWPSGVVCEGVTAARDAVGRLRVVHRVRRNEELFDLVVEAWREGPGLRLKIACPQRLTDIALGPADQKAPRVYYGHAYCVLEPKAFRASGGGHNLAASHVGFDFEKGVSLLTACDNPPDALVVDPDSRTYALHTHHEAMLTFVPGSQGALDCAMRYRPIYDKQPAGGVAGKAGRFVFDIWGGRYADDAARLQRLFDYGLTDSLYLKHVWQRWGYDYRLPDIYPPEPKLGTLEELQEVGRICDAHKVPWGLHDNYVDLYPDCEGFTYDLVSFNENGQPRKAWYNQGRDAQSYSWRPDLFLPFLKRNLALIKENLHPSASFVDVFSSSNGFDYYDRQGNFHSKLETRRCWGECFDTIRNTFGGNAPTSSEAGSDHLIGHLDGADCQLIRLVNQPVRFGNRVECADWACVPWADAVNHARFILHGVGYSGRYESGRSRDAHGIESDDYISNEILTGHALMIDAPAFGRGAVRKYWLAQDFIRSIALDDIADVQFAGGNIHRQQIRWKRGGLVYVNRGKDDWKLDGRVLPPYGYAAQDRDGKIQSAIERLDGVIVEQSRAPGRFYVNARGFDPNPRLKIRAAAQRVEYLGDRKFKLLIDWNADEPAPKDLNLFVHFYKPQVGRLVKIGFAGLSAKPSPGTSQWKGSLTTGATSTITIPEDIKPDTYEVLVGMTDSAAKKRVRLEGDEDAELRYRIGRLTIEGVKGGITGVQLDTSDVRPAEPSRLNTQKKPVDFGPVVTTGALRCAVEPGRLLVTPLPDGDAFATTLRLDRIFGKSVRVVSLQAIDAKGRPQRKVDFRMEGPSLTFETRPEEFAYEVRVE